ncbi:MAG TPA: hypothetical protein VN156_06875 [Pseudomonas sp.]|nr:hypothetical protein [Pseudomonas sp.]
MGVLAVWGSENEKAAIEAAIRGADYRRSLTQLHRRCASYRLVGYAAHWLWR